MWKRNDLAVAVLMIVMTLVLTSQAQERPPESGPSVFRPEPGQSMGLEHPMPPIREYAEQLRMRAREAQELADRLRRKAEELEQMAPRGPMPEKGSRRMIGVGLGPVDPMQRELIEIKEAIGRAELEGRREQAQDLRRRAEQLANEMRSREPKPGMKELESRELRERIERLQGQAREAAAAGREQEARRLREEAEAVEVKVKIQVEARSMAAKLEAMRGKAAELREQSKRAKGEGRYEEAGELWEKAENIERECNAGTQKIERFKVESQLKYVRMLADRAEKRGELDKAEDLARQARELEQLLDSPKLKADPEKGGDELPRLVEELRREVKRLRGEMEELKKQVRQRESR